MPNHPTDTRGVKLVDLPLVRRLAENGMVLDSELGFTRAVDGLPNSVFYSILARQRGLVTLLAGANNEHVIGQFRLKQYDHYAQMIYMAPRLEEGMDDTLWLHVLDAMAVASGRGGAHVLTAEVDEDSPLFLTMRSAGFAIYARQQIWRRLPGQMREPEMPLRCELREQNDGDSTDIQALYCNIVPRLVQQIVIPSSDSRGVVYRPNGRLEAYVAVSEGKGGIFLMPYLHPDILFKEAAAILEGVVARMPRADRLPVYVCVRRYQDWLEETLAHLGYESAAEQAVMVRHIAAGVRQANFAPLIQTLEAVPQPIRPPTRSIGPLVGKPHRRDTA
jgi:hypothetical protein